MVVVLGGAVAAGVVFGARWSWVFVLWMRVGVERGPFTVGCFFFFFFFFSDGDADGDGDAGTFTKTS